ncbi:Glycine cleavage system H protein (lipoate-binding) [Phaffia rhodozyma]|uniref:Glycine cleavage system H protein n=1 Tax=Phaffia rhodozyma TaxID=264483 RepID=A0A0F7SWC3_PHARH|nr:Glycine cleavage system H protein (lipoate-binding) [Phaffia rhodozyma]
MLATLRPFAFRAIPSIRAAAFHKQAFASYSYRTIVTRYTNDHEWASLDKATNLATVGITDYAQKALGDVVFVELPNIGETVAQGDECGSIESVKAASEVYAPLSGTVHEVNSQLDDSPSLINKSSQEKGWLFKLRLTNPEEFEELLDEAGYKALTD